MKIVSEWTTRERLVELRVFETTGEVVSAASLNGGMFVIVYPDNTREYFQSLNEILRHYNALEAIL